LGRAAGKENDPAGVVGSFSNVIYFGIRMIKTINTAAQDRMQVRATIVVAMMTALPWS
jgi:hypothetical protein